MRDGERLLPVLFRVSIAVIKHHSQKQLRDRGMVFILT